MSIFLVHHRQIKSCDPAGKELKLLQSKDLDPDEHPIYMQQSEIDALNWEHLSEIIQDVSKSPLEMVGVSSDRQLNSSIVSLIQREFLTAISDYKKLLNTAIEKDKAKIVQLTAEKKYIPICSGIGGGFLLGLPGLIISRAIALGGVALGGAGGYFGGKKLCKNTIGLQGSIHRKLWLAEVNTLEMKRLERARSQLEMNAKKLFRELDALKNDEETDLRKLRQAKEVDKLYHALFGGTISLAGVSETEANLTTFLTKIKCVTKKGEASC